MDSAEERRPAVADILEPNPLVRLHVADAARALGFVIADDLGAAHASQPNVRFVGLDAPDCCRRCAPRHAGVRSGGGSGPLAPSGQPGLMTVGYVCGSPSVLAAHMAHRCTDFAVALRVVGGRATFVYPVQASLAVALHSGSHDPASASSCDLTAREADVLILLLADLTTSSIAARLCLSPATVRSHCRAILRKSGTASRRDLRARLLDDRFADVERHGCRASPPE